MEWKEVAGIASLVVMGIGALAWILRAFIGPIVDAKLTAAMKEVSHKLDKMSETFVTKEMLAVIERESALTHARYEKTFNDLWEIVNDMRKDTR